MTQFLIEIFGTQDHLSTAQEAARAVLIFAYGLALLRAAGPRMFGQWSALDITVTVMVGSALARTMTGGAPLLGTMAAAAVMTILHVAISYWVASSQKVAHLVEGRPVTLIDHGRIDHRLRRRSMISQNDMHEALRMHGIDGEAHADNVKRMTLEPSGKLSVVKIEPCRPDRS